MKINENIKGNEIKVTAKVTGKRQITIPKEICEMLGIDTGDKVIFVEKNNEIIFRKAIDKMICPICDGTGDIEEIECFFCKGKKEIPLRYNSTLYYLINIVMNDARKYNIAITVINQQINEDNSVVILDKPKIIVNSSNISDEKIKEINLKLQELI